MLALLTRKRPIALAPYAGYRSEERLMLRVRVLKRRPFDWDANGSFRKFLKMMRLYVSREVRGVTVRLDGLGLTAEAVSDREGYALFDLTFDRERPLPRHTEWQHVTLFCDAPRADPPVEARVLAPGTDGRLAVISDVDDTIIETGAHAFFRNLRRVFAELPGDRIAVPGAPSFYTTLGIAGGETPEAAPRRPFFYISSSPWNLYGFLEEFKRRNDLPRGPMLLRDWGFNRNTLAKASHGMHKRRSIRHVLTFYPRHRFVLIGDDTQGDAEAFADMADEFPERIAAVLIRSATGVPLDEAKSAAVERMQKQNIPVWIGADFEEGHKVLKSLGFTPDGETSRVLGATEGEAA